MDTGDDIDTPYFPPDENIITVDSTDNGRVTFDITHEPFAVRDGVDLNEKYKAVILSMAVVMITEHTSPSLAVKYKTEDINCDWGVYYDLLLNQLWEADSLQLDLIYSAFKDDAVREHRPLQCQLYSYLMAVRLAVQREYNIQACVGLSQERKEAYGAMVKTATGIVDTDPMLEVFWAFFEWHRENRDRLGEQTPKLVNTVPWQVCWGTECIVSKPMEFSP